MLQLQLNLLVLPFLQSLAGTPRKNGKSRVRGVRPIERALEEHTDKETEVVRGNGLVVRSVPTNDGQPPLEVAGH